MFFRVLFGVLISPKLLQGYFIRPTIITGLSDASACMQEEIFGPVVCVSPFETEEEVIERANNVFVCSSICFLIIV